MGNLLTETTPGEFRRPLLAICAAGLLAGFLSFGLGEITCGSFAPDNVPQPLGGGTVMRPNMATIATADSRNSAMTFGMMGGVLGLVLGLTGGLLRRSIGAAGRSGVSGLFFGAILGIVLPLVLIIPYHAMQVRRNSDDLLVPIGLHAVLWGPLGAAAGLAFAMGRGRPGLILRCTLAGLGGAIFGAVIYDVIGAALSPLAGTSDAISTTPATRLLARLLVPMGAALAIGLTARDGARPA